MEMTFDGPSRGAEVAAGMSGPRLANGTRLNGAPVRSEVPVHTGRDQHAGRPVSGADLRDRADRDRVVARFELDRVSAADLGANAGYGLAST